MRFSPGGNTQSLVVETQVLQPLTPDMRLLRLGTQSARKLRRSGFALASAFLVPGLAMAQLTTGVIEGTLRALDGSSAAAAEIVITGAIGFRTVIHSDS